MARAHIDDSRFPLLQVRLPAEMDDGDWADYHERVLVDVVAQRVPYVLIQDLRGGHKPNAKQRKHTTDLWKRFREPLATYLLENVVVVDDGALARTMLGLLTLMAGAPFPIKFVSSLSEAEEIAVKALGR